MRAKAIACGLVVAVAACSPGGAPSDTGTRAPAVTSTAPSPSATPSGHAGYAGPPRGLLAIGHSQLTGYDADPDTAGDASQYSWATGTDPKVDSIYQRLVRADPSSSGWVANNAVDGGTSDTLVEQAQAGLAVLPRPRLLIVQTIDNDMECDGPPPGNLGQFRSNIRAALQLVVTKSPGTVIMMFGQQGRPATYAKAVAHDRNAVARNKGSDRCALFDIRGHLVPSHVQTLTAVLESYESVVRSECGKVEQCHYSDALAHITPSLRALTTDFGHPSVYGARQFAAAVWPLVRRLLHLSAAG